MNESQRQALFNHLEEKQSELTECKNDIIDVRYELADFEHAHRDLAKDDDLRVFVNSLIGELDKLLHAFK